ncbi:MAG: hypothetical protein JW729_10215 [Bacteroidales bacterium]|nr:hypothetical protein [Bacteroidales bacterium]
MQKKLNSLFIILLLFITSGFSQDLEPIPANYPYENIRLTTDRDIYLSGESIWFNAQIYCTDASEINTQIIYLELFNADQKSIARHKYRVKQNQASGVMEIPSEFLSGTYFLRAYTNYNKNFAAAYYFTCTLQIINPKTGITLEAAPKENKIEVYPASYSIGSENEHSFSFRIPTSLRAINDSLIVLENSSKLKTVAVPKYGMGRFSIMMNDSSVYSLEFKDANLADQFHALDSQSPDTYELLTSATVNGQQIVSIKENNKLLLKNKIFSIELLNNQFQVLTKANFVFENKLAQLYLPNALTNSPGFYYMILRDAEGKPIKIQAILISENQKDNSIALLNKNDFHVRERVELTIPKKEENGSQLQGLKVVRTESILPTLLKLDLYLAQEQLLLSYLKSDFDPFSLKDEEIKALMPILNAKLNSEQMKTLLNPPAIQEIKWIPEVRDIGLSGIVIDKNTQKPMADIPVYLSVFQGFPQIHIYNSRSDGSFLFSLNNFENEQDVFLCPLFDRIDELELKVNTDFSTSFPSYPNLAQVIDSSYVTFIEQLMVASQTSQAYRIDPKLKNNSISNLPYSFENPQATVVLDDYIETPTLEMVFKELIPNVRVRKTKQQYRLEVFDSEQELMYKDPLILVDNIPIFNVNELLKISPSVIEKIELHATPFILGDHTINGIIMISTFSNNFGGMIMPKSSTFFEYQTLFPDYFFKAKSYNSKEEKEDRLADFRTLLFWKTSFDLEKESKIQFYTSDQTGEYEIQYTGKYENGQVFHSKQTLRVVK